MSQGFETDPGAALIREVDEEVRLDQYRALWRKWGNHVVGAAAAAALIVGGVALYRENEERKVAEASERFTIAAELADKGKHEEAAAALAALQDAAAPYGALARLRLAGERAALGEADAALALYDAAAQDHHLGQDFRDLASLRSAALGLDKRPAEETRKRLAPLAQSGATYRFTAHELLAALALREGDKAVAETELRQLLGDADTPPGLRARAGDLLDAMGLDPTPAKPGAPADRP